MMYLQRKIWQPWIAIYGSASRVTGSGRNSTYKFSFLGSSLQAGCQPKIARLRLWCTNFCHSQELITSSNPPKAAFSF
jgi:hypothetical protein